MADDRSVAASKPRVYTVPPGRSFLEAIAAAILDGNLPIPGGHPPDQISLPAITLMLPTRRATRAVQEAFLKVSGGRAMLLPRILPIAEGQEDLTLLSEAVSSVGVGAGIAGIPPAIGEMERRLALTTLVQRWIEATRGSASRDAEFLSDGAAAVAGATPAQAAHLAAELSRLLDSLETENIDPARLAGLVKGELARHWDETLTFLEIVTAHWPEHQKERGTTSPADRRNRLILAEAERLSRAPPSGPVIVAGVTGSVPATAELMRTVARLPNGAIVLPGLDLDLDEESWRAIAPTPRNPAGHAEHPQHDLKKLLATLGLERGDIAVLPGAEPAARQAARNALVSEAMRPADTTGRWSAIASDETWRRRAGDALDGLTLIEAPTEQDEAEAVALLLREAVETPGRTAALVSPDRLLARRVAIRLEAWGIRVDDSAGRPFRKTPPGAFLDLLIEAVASRFAPRQLMALLKHPLTRLGLDPFSVRVAGRTLELAAFRAPYLGDGLEGVEAALERAAQSAKSDSDERPLMAVRRLWPEDWDRARTLVAELVKAFEPLAGLFRAGNAQPFSALAAAHIACAERVARLPESEISAADAAAGGDIPSPLWEGEAGATAAGLFAEIAVPGRLQPVIHPSDYPDLFRSLIGSENVRPRVPVHPRLAIWGPFEARLQQADTLVLGSLNDGTWPESADPGPWLNRTMRQSLGLPSPEEGIGRLAHDFTQLLGAERVVMTRALKVDGVPTVPSRWLLRLNALLAGLGHEDALRRDPTVLGWARARDAIKSVKRIDAPTPRPAVALRPRQLSVSRVETWMSNPYAIFARNILKLEPLPALGTEPGAAMKGSVIHAALAKFAARHPEGLPDDIAAELMSLARAEFAHLKAHPRVAAFWIPRFERFANWFAETEPARRKPGAVIVSETSGRLVLDAPAGPFTLTARADRIDVADDGLTITDYKTGQLPKRNKVHEGRAPQLPLEAAIAAAGLFQGVPAGPVKALVYIAATGGEPPGKIETVGADDNAALAHVAVEGLKGLVSLYDDAETAYEPKRRASFDYRYDDYALLARVAEWSADWEGSSGEGGE